MKIALLLDTKFLLYRSVTTQFHLTHNEIKTGAHYTFWATTRSLAKKFKPTNTVAMIDSDKSYRKKIFPGYKVKKQSTGQKDENLIQQLVTIKDETNVLRQVLQKINFAEYRREGLEADDLFEMFIHEHKNKYDKFIIATSDEDMFQLLQQDRIEIFDPKKKKIRTEKWFFSEYGIHPIQWIDVKTYGGCKSDKIPGIVGVSPETVIQWLKGEKQSKKIMEQKNSDIIQIYKKLVSLPFPCRTPRLLFKQTKLDTDAFFDYCQYMGFKSFIKEMDIFEELFG
jgi:DNA polymerase I